MNTNSHKSQQLDHLRSLSKFPNLARVQHPIFLQQLGAIASSTDADLKRINITRDLLDAVLSKIIVAEGTGEEALRLCWGWSGTTVNSPARPLVWGLGKSWYAYRIIFQLHIGRPLGDLLVRHRCPGGPNPLCTAPGHLACGTHQQNMQDREDDGRNGAKLYPERILRGAAHPSSRFDLEQREIIAATFYHARDKYGLHQALARQFKCHRGTIARVIEDFEGMPDPQKAISQSHLDIRNPRDRKGDLNSKARIPEAAFELFYQLFHRTADEAGRSLLLNFVSEKYSTSIGHLVRVGRGELRRSISAKFKGNGFSRERIAITEPLLVELFRPYSRLR